MKVLEKVETVKMVHSEIRFTLQIERDNMVMTSPEYADMKTKT